MKNKNQQKKRKILIYGLSPAIGGIETYIITILQNINREKYEIDLLVNNSIPESISEKIDGFYRRVYEIPKFKKRPLKSLLSLKKICIENKYDILHMNICNSASSIYALMFKIFYKDTKIIFHSHNGDDPRKIRHFIFKPILNILSDKKIACSKIAGEWMFGNRAISNNEIIFLRNFIDTEKFLYNEVIRNKVRKELNLKNKFVLGNVGRFNAQKNHRGLIDIFNCISKENDNVILMLIGVGELEKDIKSYIKKLNLENKVLFLGLINNVNDYYQAMDLFMLPSFFEGLPFVGIEAQASGLKCLFSNTIDRASDITGNIKFLPLEDLAKWKDEIINIINSNYKRVNMKKNIVNAGYDLKTEIKKIEKLYDGEEL